MEYWIIEEGRAVGPYSLEQLGSKRLVPSTRVWYSGLSEWVTLGDLPEYRPYMCEAVPFPPPKAPECETCAAPPAAPQPPTYLGWAIASTVVCSSLFGILAVIFTVLTNRRYSAGDIKGAAKMGEWAEWMIIISITVGLLSVPFSLIINMASASLGI